jgi:hypothetical protein
MIFSLGGLNRGAETSNDGRRQSLVHRLPEPPNFFWGVGGHFLNSGLRQEGKKCGDVASWGVRQNSG